jgi:hypothetical protein
MGISGISNSLSPVSNVSADNTASVLVAKKALEIQRQQGAASVKLIDAAGIDGKGTAVNTYA